jgi:hypothetical protein
MRLTSIVLGIAVLGGTAWADADRDVLREVAKCADIAAAPDRLKCFDAAVPHAQAALTQPEAPAQTAQTTTQSEGDSGGVLGWFGFERPVTKTEDFGKPAPRVADPKEITQLNATVTEFARTPTGKVLFILDNGQIWRQIDGDPGNVADPSANEQLKVAIEKGFFGSYNLKIEGKTGLIKVRRVK